MANIIAEESWNLPILFFSTDELEKCDQQGNKPGSGTMLENTGDNDQLSWWNSFCYWQWDFKPECNVRTVMNLKENVNPTGLCMVEGQQKLLLVDSRTFGGLVVLNPETEVPCAAKFRVSLNCHSVIFRHHITHAETVFSWGICLRWQEKSRESGHNNWWWYEWSRGQVHRCSKSDLPNRDNFWEGNNTFCWHMQQKCQVYYQDIGFDKVYQSNGRHSSCLPYSFWYSRSCRFAISLKSQATHWESGKTLMQILQNAKAKFKVSGMKPRRTPAKKTVASVTFIENFLHRLWTRLGKDCPHLLEVVDVRTFLTLVNEYLKLILRPNH